MCFLAAGSSEEMEEEKKRKGSGGNIEERRRADKDRVGKVKWTEDKKENEEKGKTERK